MREMLPCTDGIPNHHVSTVNILRSAYPDGLQLGSENFVALFAFLDDDGFSHRAIAEVVEFAFDIDYYDVVAGWPLGNREYQPEIQSVEQRLAPHGLAQWRAELE